MSELSEIAKIILLVAGLHVSGYAEGDGAYYHRVNMRRVCERRNLEGWTPERLDCSQTCLAAWGRHEPDMLGRYVLVSLPGCSDYRI